MADTIKRHITHIKSSGGTGPLANQIEFGEIAVGYKEGSEALYIKNSSGEVVSFTTAAGGQGMAELYTDKRVITKVTGDTEISVSLSASGDTSGRTLTITHATGSATTGFNKLVSDSYGHITSGTPVTTADLVGKGALSGVTGEHGISASTKANGNQKIGHTNYVSGGAGTAKGSSGSVAHGGSFDIPSITYDAHGHITASGKTTVTLPGNDNYISGITATNSGISLSVTDKVLKAGHTNSTTAGTAKGSSGSVDYRGKITIPSVTYDAHGHITSSSSTEVTLPDNYISGITSTSSGISLSVISRVLKAGHTNNITAGSAKTTSSTVTITPVGDKIRIPVIAFDAHGHITKSGETQVTLKVNSATTGTAGVVKIATTTGSNNTNTVMTQGAVTQAIDDAFTAQDAMRYKGILSAKTQFESLTNYSVGDTYKVSEDFTTTAGHVLQPGDMVIAQASGATFNANNFNYIQANLDPNIYALKTTTFRGAGGLEGGGDLSTGRTISHKILAPSGESGTTSPNTEQTPVFGATFKVPVVSYDQYGHITATTTTTVKIPNSAATTSVAGLMSKDDKATLNTLSSMTGVASTLSAITASTTAINSLTGSVGTMAFQNASSYSSATQVETALSGKVPTSRKVSAGAGLTGGGDLTADRTIKAALSSETKSTLAATAMGSTSDRQYAVGLDKNGVLSVNIPWTNVNSSYTTSAFTTVSVVGSSTVSVAADKKHDTITLEKDDAITLTGDATNDKVTFGLGNIECGDYA